MVEYVANGNSKKLKQRQRQRQQEWKKTQHSTVVGLISKTTTSHVHHAFLNISLPSLHDYNVKNAEFQVGLRREHKISTFFFFT